MHEEDGEEPVPGKVAAEDYRRQRQTADHGRDAFAAEVRAHFEDHIKNGREQMLALLRSYGVKEDEADALLDLHIADVTSPAISKFDDPYGHALIRSLVSEITAICEQGGVAVREGVVIGVSVTDGLHAYQSEVPLTGASIIDFAMPFTTFCNQFAMLLARTLEHNVEGDRMALSCDPAFVRKALRNDTELRATWVRLFARYAIEGWPQSIPRTGQDTQRLSTRLHMVHAMELFAVAHEYGHHVLLHGLSDSSLPTSDPTQMEHDADGFGRMISIAIGSNAEPPNYFEITGAGGVLMLGSLDLVRRTIHVLTTGNTDFPPRDIHPPLADRIKTIGAFDDFVPERLRDQCAAMRADLLGVVEEVWVAIEPMLLEMFKKGVRLPDKHKDRTDWIRLI
jgi:hypothetical protein